MHHKYLDEPDEYEQRTIDRHPLTRHLNRKLLDSFRRNSHLKEELQSDIDDKPLDKNVSANRT